MKIGGNRHGTTLIEALVMISILSFIAISIIGGSIFVLRTIGTNQARLLALSVANKNIETVRNMPYDNIGTTLGWPPGDIPSTQNVNLDKYTFTVNTDIQFIDDPFDGDALGSIPAKPTDTEPSDYKRVEINVCWNIFPCSEGITLTTTMVPNGVESAPGTGSLFVDVFNASGLPVSEATVIIDNPSESIFITNTTDINGKLQVLSLPPDTDDYNINISKNGYSTDYTLDPNGSNPNPVKPDTTVNAGAVTQTSFAIDQTSTLNISTVDQSCNQLGNINFDLVGAKLDNTTPDVYKFSTNATTDASGLYAFNSIEWDNYTFTINDVNNDIAGTSEFLPLDILPNTVHNLTVNLATTTAHRLLVFVKNGSDLPLTGATVHVTSTTYDVNQSTGQGTFQQDGWSGGGGQTNFTSTTQYFSDDSNIETSENGQLTLKKDTNTWPHVENFSITTNKDAGATNANWDTTNSKVLLADDTGNPGNFLPNGQAQSITLNNGGGRVTQATLIVTENLNGQTIDYFLTSDGVTYEAVTPGIQHNFAIVGNDLRWRAVLSTTNTLISPELLSLTINYDEETSRTSGTLTSSSFNAGPGSNFNTIRWLPLTQLPQTGSTPVRLQFASNNDNSTWNFIGPDGTSSTYYETSGDVLHSTHTNNQYIRYKIFLTTEDVSATPIITQTSIIHSAGCLPPGQTFYPGMSSDTYEIEVSLTGYDTFTGNVTVNGYTTLEITLNQS